jgi:hypothetical protein
VNLKLTNKAKGYLGIFLLLAQLTNLIPPAYAQSGWSATIDFTTADGGWSLVASNGTSPGWINGLGWSSGTAGFWVDIEKAVPGGDSTTRLTSAEIHVVSVGATVMDSRVPPNNELNFDINFAENYSGYLPFPFSTGVGSYTMDNAIQGGTLRITAHAHDDGSGGYSGQYVAITSIHLTGTGTPPDLTLDPTAIPNQNDTATCKTCTYNPIGDWSTDLPALMAWVVCQISNIFYCQLIPILMGMWNTMFKLLLYAQATMAWIVGNLQAFANWSAANTMVITRYGGAYFDNGVSRITESVAWSNSNAYVIDNGGGGSNLSDVLIALVNQIGSVFNSIVNQFGAIATGLYQFFDNFIAAFKDLISQLIGGVSSVAIALISAFFSLIVTIINAVLWLLSQVFQLVGIIPQFVSNFSGAYSEAVVMPTLGPDDLFAPAVGGVIQVQNPRLRSFVQQPDSYVANCDNQIMFHVCLAWYIIDNTVYNNTGAPGLLSVFTPALALTVLMIVASVSMFIRWIRRFAAALGFA